MIVSIGPSRQATYWHPMEMTWMQFISRAAEAHRTNVGAETHAEYMALPKDKQDRLKDVGGYVGGELREGKRRAGYCTGRWLITLDADNISCGWETVKKAVAKLGWAYLLYSTRKHTESAPRLRIVLPCDREVAPDEYQPLARAVAALIWSDLSIYDPTTFEVTRLMYWPSKSKDQRAVFQADEFAEDVPVDEILGDNYADWHDVRQWPTCPGEKAELKKAEKQADPTAKRGVVGAFCRCYTVPEAIETFLSDRYAEADGGRYTFIGGSTTGGAVVYEDGKFLFSHHATDPAGGKLVNAWDLVRLHLFGDRDMDAKVDTPSNKLPSWAAMCELAEADNAVADLLAKERLDEANEAVDGFGEVEGADPGWRSKLDKDKTGSIRPTVQNLRLILECDDQLRGRIWINKFNNRMMCRGPLPWPSEAKERAWQDGDDAGLRWYLEYQYRVNNTAKTYDAVNIVAEKNAVDPVADYLTGLTWDGVERLDTLFIDYLGAADNPYTRAVARKSFTAAVARVFRPGVKYDQVPILAGPQGVGKTTLLNIMGGEWFSNSITRFEGKDARESIQGVWLVELGELTALDKSEAEECKQFLSQTEDWFRPAYGRRSQQFPRRCVFFGTSNKDDFLRDLTGNRRYWPVDVGVKPHKKDVFKALQGERDQVWAEAVHSFKSGESLFMDGAMVEAAEAEQEKHLEADPWEGLIADFLEKPIPVDWQKWELEKREMWWAGNYADAADVQTTERQTVCVAEIWGELFKMDRSRITNRDTRRISAALTRCRYSKATTSRCGPWGTQKAWRKM